VASLHVRPQVAGLTKAGKEFFSFAATTTDALRCLAVADRHIWAVSDYRLSCWVDGVESWVYDCPDRIHAAEVGGARTAPPPPLMSACGGVPASLASLASLASRQGCQAAGRHAGELV